MTSSRDTDIIKAVIRSPRTAKMVYIASPVFNAPYTNFTQVKTDLRRLTDGGYLAREETSSRKSGRNEFIYYPKRKAREIIPELRDFRPSSAVFKTPTGVTEHTLYVSEFVSHVERSAGAHKDRIEILETKRDGYFTAKVELNSSNGEKIVRLIPDRTLLVEIDDTVTLFFLELQNHARSIESVTHENASKTFREKLMKYKAFQRDFRWHPFVREAEQLYGSAIFGFRVLIVTTKNEMNRNRLIACARGMGYGEMFHFATMDEIRQGNVFSQPIWSLTTSGGIRKATLMDCPSSTRYHSKTSPLSASPA